MQFYLELKKAYNELESNPAALGSSKVELHVRIHSHLQKRTEKRRSEILNFLLALMISGLVEYAFRHFLNWTVIEWLVKAKLRS